MLYSVLWYRRHHDYDGNFDHQSCRSVLYGSYRTRSNRASYHFVVAGIRRVSYGELIIARCSNRSGKRVLKRESFAQLIYYIVLTINPADPSYTVPTGLEAIEGQTLADVTLEEGFSFEDPLTTPVGAVGDNEFSVTYTPSSSNYKVVGSAGLMVKVAVIIVVPSIPE